MELLHFSDCHIGVTVHGKNNPATGMNTRVADSLKSLDVICDYVEKNRIDIVLFAGDAFHHRSPRQLYQTEFARRISRMADYCPVVLVVGNHDSPGYADASTLDVYAAMNVPNIHIGNKFEVLMIDTESGPLQVATMPYPYSRMLRDCGHKVGGADDYKVAAQSELMKLEDAIDEDIPSVLVAHIGVEGCKYGPIDIAMEYGAAQYALADLEAGPWDYVALGHIHTPQVMSKSPPIIYAGSTERVDFGEEDQQRGFYHISITDDEVTWDFIELPVRNMITIPLDLKGKRLHGDYTEYAISLVDDLYKIVKDSIVRLIISINDVNVHMLNAGAIEDALLNMGAFSVAINMDIVHAKRSDIRLEGNVAAMTPAELLEAYLDPIITDDAEFNRLMDLGEEIMKAVDSSQ